MSATRQPSIAVAAAIGAFACLAAPIASASDETLGIEGRHVAEALFDSMDTGNHKAIHFGYVEEFRKDIFVGMDIDEDRKVTYSEFAQWDPGFASVAAELGRADALKTAKKIVFAYWDRNGDGALHGQEMRTSLSADFRRADLDDDAFLTRDEFIQGFPIIIAMRAAIRPDL